MAQPQFTIHRLMVVVAAVAALLGFCRAIGTLPTLLILVWPWLGWCPWAVCRTRPALAVRVLASCWAGWAVLTGSTMVTLGTASWAPGIFFLMLFYPCFVGAGIALAVADWGPDPLERIPLPELVLIGMTALMGVVIGAVLVLLLIDSLR